MSINLKLEILKIFRLEISITYGKNKQEEITNNESNSSANTSIDESKPTS